MPTLGSGTILPAWLVVPLGIVTLLVIAAHVLAIQEILMPVRRRRIRTACGLLMMMLTCLLAYALGLAPVGAGGHVQPAQARTFLQVWLVIISLLGLVVMLAGLDALATIRQHTKARRAMRAQLREGLEQVVRERMAARRLRRGSLGGIAADDASD